MDKRIVFNGYFEVNEIPIGFNSGKVIIYRSGNKKKSMSLEEFAEQILEKMEFVNPILFDKGYSPSVKITVDIRNK